MEVEGNGVGALVGASVELEGLVVLVELSS